MSFVKENKKAIVALTKGGTDLALSLKEKLADEADLFLPERFKGELNSSLAVEFFPKWRGLVKDIFNKYEELIFIMATGIVVRSLAPYLEGKDKDPAVLVLDEKGQFVISLLSGHLGGANDLAKEIAGLLGSIPVITTATDVNEKYAVDLLARDLDLKIVPLKRMKFFNRVLAEGGKLDLYVDDEGLLKSLSSLDLQESFNLKKMSDLEDDRQNGQRKVLITNKEILKDDENILYLRPKNLIVGMGCRRGVKKEDVMASLTEVLEENSLSIDSIKALTSIDLKADEVGLQETAKELGVDFVIVSRDEVNSLDYDFPKSAFVKKMIGVDGVCQPTAKIVSKMGPIVVPKTKKYKTTVAIAKERSMLSE